MSPVGVSLLTPISSGITIEKSNTFIESKMALTKITKKGQITIPIEYRKRLGTDMVRIEMEGEKIVITPARELGGVFHKYAFTGKPIEEVMEMEKRAMEETFAGEGKHR